VRKRGVLRGPLRDDRVYPLESMDKILKMRPVRDRVMVELMFNITSDLLHIPKHMERTTQSKIISVAEEIENLTPGEIVIHGNRAGFQFSFRGDKKSRTFRLVPHRMIQAVIKK